MKEIAYLRYWCHKILPLVYEDSLSYYEVLCKMKAKLNEVIENVNEIPTYIDGVIDEKLSEENIKRILREYVLSIEAAISANNELDNANSTHAYTKGQMLWWKDNLYLAKTDIPVGTTLIPNVNIEQITFENLFDSFKDKIKKSITDLDEKQNEHADRAIQRGKWLWHDDVLYKAIRDIAFNEPFVVGYNIEAITVEDDTRAIYIPEQDKLIIHGKIDSRIIVNADYHVYHPETSTIEIREVE